MLLSQFIVLDTCNSTNNYIAKLANRGIIPHGTVVLSYEQTDAKGQRGADWFSEPEKNLTISIYFEHQDKAIEDFQYFSYAISLSVFDLLKAHGINADIKWPNDLLVENKKIAGILIENKIGESGWKSSVVGIGLNVNQIFEENNGNGATSMTKLLNEEFSLEALAFELLEILDSWHILFEENQYQKLKDDYFAHLWKLNEDVRAIINEKEQIVIIKGIDESGLLQIQVDDKIKSFDIKEVKFIY